MIERIPEYYVSDECVQLTLPFYNNITVFDGDIYKKGVLCHYNLKDDSQNINKYLLDDRRYNFPYSNIPIYKGLFGRYYINQLFEYNKHYLSITNGFIRDRYLTFDGNTAVMLNRHLSIPICIGGRLCSKEEIKIYLNNNGSYLLYDRYGREYFYERDCFRDIDNFIDNGGGLFILKDRNSKIIIKLIRIKNDIGYDSYVYREYDISLNDYAIEELKCFCSKMKDSYEPSVYSIFNPNIDKKDIREAKRLVRKLSNK